MDGHTESKAKHLALGVGTLAAILCLAPRTALCDPPPPINGLSQRTVYTPNPDSDGDRNGDGDTQQQAAVIEQWTKSGTTRNSIDQVLKNLSAARENQVVRKMTRYPGGAKKSQDTVVTSKLPGKRLLYAATDQWTPSGKLESTFRQVDTLNSSGVQVDGKRTNVAFVHERIVSEKREQWDSTFHGWLETYSRTSAYYPDGDLKERITMLPPENRKTKEGWGPGHGPTREKSNALWDEKSHAWGDPPPGK